MKVGLDNVNRNIMEKCLDLMGRYGEGELRWSASKGTHILRCGMQAGQWKHYFAVYRNGKHTELHMAGSTR